MEPQNVFIPNQDFTQSTPQFCKPTDLIQGAEVARNFLGRGIWFGQNADFWIFIHNNLVGLEINAEHTFPVSRIMLDKDDTKKVKGVAVQGLMTEKSFADFCKWCLETYMKIPQQQKAKLPPTDIKEGNLLDYSYWIRTNALIAKNEIVDYLMSANDAQMANCEKLKRTLQNLEKLLKFNNRVIRKLEGDL